MAISKKVYATGGSKSGWLHEAFQFWDKRNIGIISQWDQVQGAVKRLGMNITQEEAECLVTAYDKYRTGDLHYNYLIKDIIGDDPHFLADATRVDMVQRSQTAPSSLFSSRAPVSVKSSIHNFRKAADIYMRKSQGTTASNT